MRISLLISGLLLSSFHLKAQEKVAGFAHGSFIISAPQGNFASKDPSVESAGFANVGGGFSLLLGHEVYKGFGAFGNLLATAQSVDEAGVTNSFRGFLPGYEWKMNKAFWTLTGFTFGPHYSLNLKKMAFDFRLSTGALNFFSPALELEATPQDPSDLPISVTQYGSRASAWAFGGGFTTKYEFRYGWVALLGMDYLSARPSFVDVKTTVSTTGRLLQEDMVSYRQKYSLLMINLGVGVVF